MRTGEDLDNNIIPGSDESQQSSGKEKSSIDYIKKLSNEQIIDFNSNSESDEDDNEILKNFDEEEMKEINNIEGIEGLLDEDFQNELNYIENEFDQGEGDEEEDHKNDDFQNKKQDINEQINQEQQNQETSNILIKPKSNSKRKKKESNSSKKDKDENEEWILDHTGVRRKPFKIMHREIKDIH